MTHQHDIDLLLVDDVDDELRSTLVRRFERGSFQVEDAANAKDAWNLLERRDFVVVVLDMLMPGMSGLDLLKKIKEHRVDCEVILLTGQGTIETAVEALKLGAFDYLTKPFPLKDLETRIERASERHQLSKENRQLKALLERSQPQDEMVGQSAAMLEVFRLIERAGPSDKAIVIPGESGTGKELVARALHRRSPRASKPLVAINCAALPESLLESEMFGHEKGAFTGASTAKSGLFEVADGGTLFIDEIGEMPGSLPAKLLRVLENGMIRRVGSIKERRVNVRLLAATNRNLADEVKAGAFREDLYYRINVMSLELPPLREREGDVPLLVTHFLGNAWEIEPLALRRIEQYAWPGNVRQLNNASERAKIMADGITIRVGDLPDEVLERASCNTVSPIAKVDQLSTIERTKIVEILQREPGNKTRAAKSLGIDRRKLYRLVEKYDIQDEELH
ncbi:MAG: sigma-54 dependent transcriptional regulator [Planctomycetota bacterium]|nr:sigma-54 dependent transcriptional regulator [Planctomycetota bacterium]